MYIKYAPLSKIRIAASNANSLWREATFAYSKGDKENSFACMRDAEKILRKGDVCALAALISTVRYSMMAGPEDVLRKAIVVVQRELSYLELADVRPTLHLHRLAQEVATVGGIAIPERGSFFLPCLPSASFDRDSGQFLEAAEKYSGQLRRNLVNHSANPSPQTVADLRATFIALNNRAIPGEAGWMAAMSVALVDGVTAGLMDEEDASLLLSIATSFRDATQKLWVDISPDLLSRLAYRVSNLHSARAQAITTQYELLDLHMIQDDGVLPAAQDFHPAWRKSLEAWSQYVTTKTNTGKASGTPFILALRELLAVCGPNAELTSMTMDLGNFMSSVSGKKVVGTMDNFHIFVQDRLTDINSAFISGSQEQIVRAGVYSRKLISECIASGCVVLELELLPLRKHLVAASLKVSSAAEALRRDQKDKSLSFMGNAIKTIAPLVTSSPEAGEILSAAKVVEDGIGICPDEIMLPSMDLLRQSMEVYIHDRAAAKSLTQGIIRKISNAIDPMAAVSASIPNDKVLDKEIFDIFFEEVLEICKQLGSICEHCAAHKKIDIESMESLRRGFHTIKGSSRMAGLRWLGEAAWVIEQAMNYCIANGKMPLTYLKIVESSLENIWKTCQVLEKDGSCAVNVAEYESLLVTVTDEIVEQVEPEPTPEVIPEPITAVDIEVSPTHPDAETIKAPIVHSEPPASMSVTSVDIEIEIVSRLSICEMEIDGQLASIHRLIQRTTTEVSSVLEALRPFMKTASREAALIPRIQTIFESSVALEQSLGHAQTYLSALLESPEVETA